MIILTLLAAMAAEPDEALCAVSEATPVTANQLLLDPKAYEGRCITVSGWLADGSLYQDVEDFYRPSSLDKKHEPSEARFIGVYHYYDYDWDFADVDPTLRSYSTEIDYEDGPEWVTITGRAGDCESGRPNEDAPYLLLATDHSYCGWSGVAYVKAQIVAIDLSKRATRLTDQSLRDTLGTLVRLEKNDPHFAEGSRIASAFYTDMRKALILKEEDAIARHFGIPEGVTIETSRFEEFYELASSAFSFSSGEPYRYDPTIPQMALFRFDENLRSQMDEDDLADPFDFMCFCKTEDCSDVWPLRGDDTYYREDRPFACAQIIPYSPKGNDRLLGYRAVTWKGYLPEPVNLSSNNNSP